MSFLVLVLSDRMQKEQVNQLRREHPLIQEYGLVHYGKGGGKAIVPVPETPGTMEAKVDEDQAAAAETKAAEARAAAAATIQARALPLYRRLGRDHMRQRLSP